MTTQLAIGYLATPRRRAPAARTREDFAAPAGRDPLSNRPAIPQAVITWSDAEAALPVGAGDPASSIAGAPRFTVLRDRSRRRASSARPRSLDAFLFSVLVATLAGLAAAVVVQSGARDNAWVSYDTLAASPSLRPSVEVGELRVIAMEHERPSPSLVAGKASGQAVAN